MKRHCKPETVKVGSVIVKVYSRIKKLKVKGRAKPYRYPVFEVVDHTSGTRRLRMFNDHGKAMKEAERIARQTSTGEALAAGMRGPETASYARAMELLRPTGLALEVAAGIVAEAFKELGKDSSIIEAARFYAVHRPDRLLRRTVAEAVAELIENRQRSCSLRYIIDLRCRLGRFAEAFAVDIGTVTTADVQGFLDGLKLAPESIKNFRRVLSTLFKFSEARGYVFKGGNPVKGTEKPKSKGGAVEIFTPGELEALLKASPVDFVPVIVLGAFAGLRNAEIGRLEWKDIDLAGGWITVAAEKAKTRARRLVPIVPSLARWLAPYMGQKGGPWRGTPAEQFQARALTVKAAGVPWKHNALRHSFISYRLAEIQDAAKVSLEAGNSPAQVFAHYRELVKPEAARAWFTIAPEAPANVIALA